MPTLAEEFAELLATKDPEARKAATSALVASMVKHIDAIEQHLFGSALDDHEADPPAPEPTRGRDMRRGSRRTL